MATPLPVKGKPAFLPTSIPKCNTGHSRSEGGTRAEVEARGIGRRENLRLVGKLFRRRRHATVAGYAQLAGGRHFATDE